MGSRPYRHTGYLAAKLFNAYPYYESLYAYAQEKTFGEMFVTVDLWSKSVPVFTVECGLPLSLTFISQVIRPWVDKWWCAYRSEENKYNLSISEEHAKFYVRIDVPLAKEEHASMSCEWGMVLLALF